MRTHARPNHTGDLDSKQTWLITGAGRGLGRAIALAALEAGHTVAATVRSEHSLPEHPRLSIHRIEGHGGVRMTEELELAYDRMPMGSETRKPQ